MSVGQLIPSDLGDSNRGVVVAGNDELPFGIKYYLNYQSFNDRLLIIANESPKLITQNYEERHKGIKSGRFQEQTFDKFITIANSGGSKRCTSSEKATQGSIQFRRLQIDSPSSPESTCPSLETDCSRDAADRERDRGHAAVPGVAPPPAPACSQRIDPPMRSTQQPPCAPQSPGERAGEAPTPAEEAAASSVGTDPEAEPIIFSSIRQVLSRDPSYAEEVISAVRQLPDHKRNIFYLPLQAGGSQRGSGVEHRPGSSSQNLPTVSSGNRKPRSGDTQKRRRASEDSDEADGGTGQGGGGGGGGGHGGGKRVQSSKKEKKEKKCWACPYCLAYPGIPDRFHKCRPPGFMKERCDWRYHLKRYHSPAAWLKDDKEANAPFYMNDQQWEEVQGIIDAADRHRPRDPQASFQVHKDCFLGVWRVLFPDLPEPISPFHLDSDERANLEPQLQVLCETMFDIKAERAATAGSFSPQDFRPDRAEFSEMVSRALAIVTCNSPAVAQRVAKAAPQEWRAAVERYADHADHEPANAVQSHTQGYGSHSESTLEPKTPNRSSMARAEAGDYQPSNTTFVPLLPEGTRVEMQILPNMSSPPEEQPIYLYVTKPASVYFQSIKQESMATHGMVPTDVSAMDMTCWFDGAPNANSFESSPFALPLMTPAPPQVAREKEPVFIHPDDTDIFEGVNFE